MSDMDSGEKPAEDRVTMEHGPPPRIADGLQRQGSPEEREYQEQVAKASFEMKRGYSYDHPPPPHHHPHSGRSSIQSVVTTSFSTEEEREYRARSRDYRVDSRDPAHFHERPSYGRELPPIRENDREGPAAGSFDMHMERGQPSSRGDGHPYMQHRSYSSGGASTDYLAPGPMKRSFWHHARPAPAGDDSSTVPNEFAPPKRSKLSPPKKDQVMTARGPQYPEAPAAPAGERQSSNRHWYSGSRSMSWEGRDDYYHHRGPGPYSRSFSGSWSRSPPTYREPGMPTNHWGGPQMPHSHARYSEYERMGPYDRQWNRSGSQEWMPHPEDRNWAPPRSHSRDEIEGREMWVDFRDGGDSLVRRQSTFESFSDGSSYQQLPPRLTGPPPHEGMTGYHQPMMEQTNSFQGSFSDSSAGPVRLLSSPDDRVSLSETLCVVRENIEVFTATIQDVEAPAPGRKHPVIVGQVGLRCIHCRHITRSSDRVKRAVCYPSSIKRVYRTTIDMKLDHFPQCKFVPDSLKETLDALKQNNTRSTGTTMQYFIRAAKLMGMVDGPSGVRLSVEMQSSVPRTLPPPDVPASKQSAVESSPFPQGRALMDIASFSPGNMGESTVPPIHRKNSTSSESGNSTVVLEDPKETFEGQISLALPEDKMSLSPLRCFLREQVVAFTATEEDIAVRTPTTFSVTVGQVGMACVHCLSQPAKCRMNRAVCFPFSINRIYQSVADIQRFHLNECKLVPEETKKKFLELQEASSKGSKGLATRQYWVSSAKKLGLVDTARGIRFARDPAQAASQAVSLDILAQVAAKVTTVNKPLVFPEDKETIAEFLYVVMEQYQPCRFTEGDRNKRRIKDVGCIGVECKHCAGKVESRKFFWSSVSAVESNFVSVHEHVMKCKHAPEDLKDRLSELKALRKEQTAALKSGSQKAFFGRLWDRLQALDRELNAEDAKKKAQSADAAPASPGMSIEATVSVSSSIGTPLPLTGKKIEIEMPSIPSSLMPAADNEHEEDGEKTNSGENKEEHNMDAQVEHV